MSGFPAQREGVARYDKQNETWKRYTAADGLLDTMIGFVIVDNNDVWAYGGWGEGLSKYDENTDSWVIIDSSKGLVADQIREVISGVDYMWVLYNQSWWEGRRQRPRKWVPQSQSDLAGLPRPSRECREQFQRCARNG